MCALSLEEQTIGQINHTCIVLYLASHSLEKLYEPPSKQGKQVRAQGASLMIYFVVSVELLLSSFDVVKAYTYNHSGRQDLVLFCICEAD